MNYKFDESKHLHTLDGKALTGCSTITQVLSKPLTWWAAGMSMTEMGWTNSKIKVDGKYKTIPIEERIKIAEPMLSAIKNMSVTDYISLLDKAYRAHDTSKKKAAGKGIDLHAEIERYIKGCLRLIAADVESGYAEQIQPFIKWSKNNVKQFLWAEAHSFDIDTFTGGISDAGAILNDNSVAVIDFKSSKAAYTSAFIQSGGYCLQIRKNGLYDKEGNLLKSDIKPTHIVIVPFGSEPVVPVIKHCEQYEVAFKYATELYRLMQLGEEK